MDKCYDVLPNKISLFCRLYAEVSDMGKTSRTFYLNREYVLIKGKQLKKN